MTKELQYYLLGPLVFECEREQIRLGGSRQQILLVMLLLEANEVMSLDRLIAAIWNEDPPVSAKSQIRICVSELRRKFLAKGCGEIIETHASGYLLRVSGGSLDLHGFEELVRRGRRAAAEGHLEEAARVLKSALDLWRGPVAAGLRSDLLEASVVKFHEDRQTVIEEYVDLNLRLGRHREIVGELTCYVVGAPFRENLCAQLMLALHLSGRKVEALELFRSIRKRFSEELGIEPGEDLRNMEIFILTDDSRRPPHGGGLRGNRALVGGSSYRGALGRRSGVEDRVSRLERDFVQLRSEYHAFVQAATAEAGTSERR